MAYAYPDGSAPSSPVKKGGDQDNDILKEFKRKLAEDENYISYFNERIRIEQTYIDQLHKLHAKTVSQDSLHDEWVIVGANGSTSHRGQRSTARRAWVEVRDYSQREIDAREAFVNSLKERVVARLIAVRDTQARIRNRIREDLKDATASYEDHAFSKVPKLKRTYDNKCNALEEHKRQEAAVAKQEKLLSESNPPVQQQPHPYVLAASASSSPTHPQSPHHPLSPVSPGMTSHANASGTSLNILSTTSSRGSDPSPPASTITPSSAAPPSFISPTFSAPSLSLAAEEPLTPQPPLQPPALPPRNHSRRPSRGVPAVQSPVHQVQSPVHQVQQSQAPMQVPVHGRARSGSGSLAAVEARGKEVLSDVAAQGKKSFSAIMQRFGGGDDASIMTSLSTLNTDDRSLRSGSRLGSTTGSIRSVGAFKGIKAKRDAEEADKAYRSGVFHCESLRLRREKLQQSALSSLNEFNDDLNAALIETLRAFTDAARATGATLAQSTDVITDAIKQINLESDTMLFRSKLPRTGRSAPVLYKNFYVGVCRSLIFGVSLTDYDFARGEGGDHGRPPLIVEKCIASVDARGLSSEGIYRVSGRQATIKQLVRNIEQNEDEFVFTDAHDVYSIGSILKQYLRELPEPLFPLPHAERVKFTESREAHISNNFTTLRGRLRRLPPIHQTTFQAIIQHLTRVNARAAENKMDAKNLAVVFNSVVFGPDQVPTNGNALTMHQEKDSVLEDIITYSDLLFSSTPSAPASVGTPLSFEANQNANTNAEAATRDAAGGLGPARGANYGSARTRVDILPPDDLLTIAGAENFSAPRFTPDESLELLFDPVHIPEAMHVAVGEDLHVRPLAKDDLLRSHFGLLSNLSPSPPLAPSVYESLFMALKNTPDTYYIVVIINRSTDEIVASGTLITERKFIRGGGHAGHIEDIVVSSAVQGRGLGLKLVTGLRELAVGLGCYKVILDCQESKTGFYEKCGFEMRGRQMAYYAPGSTLPPSRPPSWILSGDERPKLPPRPGATGTDTGTGAGTGESAATLAPATAAYPAYQGYAETEAETESAIEESETGSSVTYTFPTTTTAPPATVTPPVPGSEQ